jgi:hypothetical protein
MTPVTTSIPAPRGASDLFAPEKNTWNSSRSFALRQASRIGEGSLNRLPSMTGPE